jgi:Raf kinase inhibitor-like YbhB/YbcL family protein
MFLDRPDAPDPYDILPARPTFALTSTDITDGQPLDKRYAHGSVGGEDVSPHLAWSGFPAETQGFVVTCFDPDAPTHSGFWHWILVGLPAGTVELPSGAGAAGKQPSGAFHVRNDYGTKAYGGAAPPQGDKTHRYVFAVHALDVGDLGLDDSVSPAYVGFNLTFHTLARGVLRATFQVP